MEAGPLPFPLTATHLEPSVHSSGQRAFVKPRLKHEYELVLTTIVKLGEKLGLDPSELVGCE